AECRRSCPDPSPARGRVWCRRHLHPQHGAAGQRAARRAHGPPVCPLPGRHRAPRASADKVKLWSPALLFVCRVCPPHHHHHHHLFLFLFCLLLHHPGCLQLLRAEQGPPYDQSPKHLLDPAAFHSALWRSQHLHCSGRRHPQPDCLRRAVLRYPAAVPLRY
ncbi:hypothetical protein EV174_007116, partial [Coemansia sp. RSA 2320]